jgi:acetyl esterase/lipase
VVPSTQPVALGGQETKLVKTPLGMMPVPTLEAHLPADGKGNGTAVIVCPGGGYQGLMDTYEGVDVARWWNEHGVAAFVLRYRIRPDKYPAALDDVQAAIRLVRENADAYGVNRKRIGVMGFSAGGHVAASAATLFHAKADRPDFAVLVYPVISFVEPYAHKGSRDNYLGKEHPKELEEELSLEKRVTRETPPCFLVQGKDDKIVDWHNSEMFDEALKAHGVKEDLVLLNHGPHGFGLKMPEAGREDWKAECLRFLHDVGMMPKHAGKWVFGM